MSVIIGSKHLHRIEKDFKGNSIIIKSQIFNTIMVTYLVEQTLADSIHCLALNHQRDFDASILNSDTASKATSFRNWLQSALIAKMSHFLQNKNQHTSEDENESRLITTVRSLKFLSKKNGRL